MSSPNNDINDSKLNAEAAAAQTAAASANEEDMQARVDDVMKKFDRESNVRLWEGVPKQIVNGLLVAFSLFCIYVTLWGTFLEEVRLTSFMACIVFLGYLIYPARKGVQKVNYIPWYDIILMVCGTGSFLYFMFNAVKIIQQGSKFSDMQIAIGVVGIICLAEVCRRSVGLPILIVASAFIIYALTAGLSNPTFVRRLNYAVRLLFYSKEGILSTPVNTCSKFIVIFIIFGAFLERTGISDFFIDFANALVGSFAGGPAKVAVVSSALLGMVSGSSVANTVGSGSVTIPLMKKTGYRGEFAGAVEAAASTGGQIMPPIMGAAAFLMADIVGTPYSNIIVRAIIPAVLYFTGIFIAVHLEAKKNDLKGIPKDQLPKMHILIRNIYLLIPIVVLVWLVSTNKRTIQSAAAIAIVLAVVVSMFDKKYRMTPAKILDALAAGGKGSISVGAACGIAGIIAGTITMTGLANVLINGIVALAGSRVIIALVLTMLCCIVLGMGVPTTANYCIMAATCRYHSAGRSGSLCRRGHRAGEPYADGAERDQARDRGLHRSVYPGHEPGHGPRGCDRPPADRGNRRHFADRYFRRIFGPCGVFPRFHELASADPCYRRRPDADRSFRHDRYHRYCACGAGIGMADGYEEKEYAGRGVRLRLRRQWRKAVAAVA